jgi:hypothetical protein
MGNEAIVLQLCKYMLRTKAKEKKEITLSTMTTIAALSLYVSYNCNSIAIAAYL